MVERPVLPLGRTDAGEVVGPEVEVGQGRHLAILGETGMGKSAMLVALARKAKDLGGVILFDPLGDTARSLAQGLTSVEQRERLLWVAPSRRDAGINALEGIDPASVDPVRADRRLNDLVHALRRVRSGRYDSSFWGPRLEEMVTRAIGAAATLPAGTLRDAHALLSTAGRVRQVVPPEARDAVREIVARIQDRPEDAEGARRLLHELDRSPVLDRMLCERDPHLHAAELVAPGRIALISGEAAIVGETVARYLLAVHLALLWSELLARATATKTFVFLDESQWFAHESLAEMLRLARRRNVHVILATQAVASLPEGVDEAVWTNVSDFVVFRGSPAEARELARTTHHLEEEDLLSLPRGHAAALLGKGSSVSWIRTVGRPSEPAPSCSGDSITLPSPSEHGGKDPLRSDVKPARYTDILSWLHARARTAERGSKLRVDLQELRAAVDPEGRAIREAGAILGRAGALLASVREDTGRVWLLDPTLVPTVPLSADDAGQDDVPLRARSGNENSGTPAQ